MSFLETEYTSHHDSNCFGFFLRYHRKKQNLSLNYFADMIGITPSFLSDIEHGKKDVAEYTKKKIFHELFINQETYENHVCKFDIVTILQAILEFDMSFLHEVYTDIEDNMDVYMETSSFHQYILAYTLTYLFEDHKTFFFDEVFMKNFICILDIEEQHLLSVCYAYNLEKNKSWKEAQKEYNKIIQNYKFTKYQAIDAWLYFRLAELNLRLGDIYHSLVYCEKEDEYLKKGLYLKRMYYNLVTKANIVSLLHQYDDAILLLDKILKKCEQDDKLCLHILNNKCAIALEQQDYPSLLLYAKQAETAGYHSAYLSFYQAFAYLCLHDIEKSKESFIDMKTITDPILQLMFSYCEHQIKGEDVSKDMKQMMDWIQNEHDFQTKKFLKTVVMQYHEQHSDYEQAYFISKL